MAAVGRLYPTLPTVNSSLMVSSDEDEGNVEEATRRRRSQVTSTEYKRSGNTTMSLSDFEASYAKKRKPLRGCSTPKQNLTSPNQSIAKWVGSGLRKWQIVLIGLFLGLATLLVADQLSKEGTRGIM